MSNDQTAEIEWRDGGIPVSTRFDDPYFSLDNGLAETRHTFLQGNDLAARMRGGFQVAELGFGTGLNMLALALAWQKTGQETGQETEQGEGRLKYTSFEAYPMAVKDIEVALAGFDELRHLAGPFLAAWAQGERRFQLAGLDVEVVIGDARVTLAGWRAQADAWFLDGFSPAKNPELWGADLMREVARHTGVDGTFATYTAAGHVRRALAEAGFSVERRPGYGRKRHMSVGRLEGRTHE